MSHNIEPGTANEADAVRRNWIRRHPKLAAVAATVAACAAIAGTGVAYAAWNASNATGGGGTIASTAPVVTAVFDSASSGYTQLYPGISNGDLLVKVTAPSQYGVTVTGFTQSGTITGCTTPGVTVNTQHSTSSSLTGVTIAASQSVWFKLTGALAMGNTSSSDCAGATLSVPLTANATSNPGASTSPTGTSATSPDAIVW